MEMQEYFTTKPVVASRVETVRPEVVKEIQERHNQPFQPVKAEDVWKSLGL